MSLFLSHDERELVERQCKSDPLRQFYRALLNRATRRAASPGLTDLTTTSEWWYHAAD